MWITTSMNAKINGTDEDVIGVAKTLLKGRIDEDEEKKILLNRGFDYPCYDSPIGYTIDEFINDIIIPICKKYISTSFVLKGVIDTSTLAGECMDYEVEFKNKELNIKYSDWYVFKGEDENDDNYDYKYDDDGNITMKIKCYHANKLTNEVKYEYDNNGNIAMRTESYFNSNEVTEYEYDDKCNMTKETQNYRTGVKSITEYEYDNEGNMIKQITKEVETTSFDIIYYNE